jgi:hypothetical protein
VWGARGRGRERARRARGAARARPAPLTVLAHVEALQLAQVLVHVVGRDGAQKIDVVVRVEARELGRVDQRRPEDVHLAVEVVRDDQLVRHPHAVRLHRVALPIVERADVRVCAWAWARCGEREKGGRRCARARDTAALLWARVDSARVALTVEVRNLAGRHLDSGCALREALRGDAALNGGGGQG